MIGAHPRRIGLAALLLAASLGLGACEGDAPAPGPTHFERDSRYALLEEIDRLTALGQDESQRATQELARRQLAFIEGWRRAWPVGWAAALDVARTERPAEFRREVLTRGLVTGGLALLMGLLLGLLLGGASPQPERVGAADDSLFVRLTRRAGRALRRLGHAFEGLVAPARQDPRLRAAIAVRGALRRVQGLGDSAAELAERADAAPSEPVLKLAEAWMGELYDVRRRVEAIQAGVGVASAADLRALVASLEQHHALAESLGVELARAEAAEDTIDALTWEAWRRALEERPGPPELGPAPTEVGEWAVAAARYGLAGLALALVLTGAWAAAGAVPSSMAGLALVAALLARFSGRAALAKAGRAAILPTIAQRFAYGLVALGVAALALLALSSSATGDSGLDLGQPPPVTVSEAPEVPAPPPTLLPRPD